MTREERKADNKGLGFLVFVQKVVGPLFRLIFRVQCIGAENVPEKGGAIIACNHLNAADPITMGSTLKRTFRTMAKEELFHNPVIGFFIRSLGGFPVERGKGDTGAIGKAEQVAKDGHLFAIYPEGTRSKTGEMGRVKSGALVIAAATGVPVIPTYITMRSTKMTPFKKMVIQYGKPISTAELFGLSEEEIEIGNIPKSSFGQASRLLRERMLELRREDLL